MMTDMLGPFKLKYVARHVTMGDCMDSVQHGRLQPPVESQMQISGAIPAVYNIRTVIFCVGAYYKSSSHCMAEQ